MTAKVAIAILLLSALAAVFAGCGGMAGNGPAPAANPASEPPAAVARAVAQAEATVLAVSSAVRADYCGQLCQVSFWLHASAADVDAEIGKGAAVNAIGGVTYEGNPLHYAVQYANIPAIAALLEHGVDLEAEDSSGYTALHIIALSTSGISHSRGIHLHNRQESDVAALLLEHGADPNSQTGFGHTPLHYVSDPVMAALLLNYGADVNQKDDDGFTALHHAVNINSRFFPTPNLTLVALLLEYGADVNAVSKLGNTPLLEALQYIVGRTQTDIWSGVEYDVVALLVEHGADLDAKMYDGQTACDYMRYFSTRGVSASQTFTLGLITALVCL